MSEKENEPISLRAHLLEVEPPDVERLQKLQQEIRTVFIKELTPSGRVARIIALVVSLVFVGRGIYHITHATDVAGQANGWLFTVVMGCNAAYGIVVLTQGVVDVRKQIAIQKILPPVAGIVAIVLIVQAVSHPTIPAIGWALFGMLWFLVMLGKLIYNRVTAAELNTREGLLRLELRMAELAEGRR